MINYLEDCKQRVALNGQVLPIKYFSRCHSRHPFGSHFIPSYIYDLLDGIKSICRIFADDTSLFSKVNDKSCSAVVRNNDQKIISNWAIQWKILFNPDPDKQVSETLFSKKKKKKREKRNYPPLILNGDNVKTTISQKHLGLVLDSELNFNEHIIRLINAIKW